MIAQNSPARLILLACACATALPACTSSAPTASVPPKETAPVEPAPAPLAEADAAASDTSQQATTNVTRATFAQEGADFDPCISRDGAKLVFASTQHRPTSDIYIKRTDSRVVTQLTNDPSDDAMPVISPDGTRIAFASNRAGNWDIYVMPITGGKAVQITSDPSDEMHPSWSSDGANLVYSRTGTSGRWEMWVSKAGNDATANFIGYGVQPKWCPVAGTGEGGADKILFQVGRERGHRSYGLWTLDYANGTTSNITEVAGGSELALMNPAWSPDGRWLAYSQADILDPASGMDRPLRTSLWIASVQGEGRVRLTGDDGIALSPSWSGKNVLYFVSDRSGIDNIWSLGLNTALTAAQASMSPANSAVAGNTPTTAEPTATTDEQSPTSTATATEENNAPGQR